MADVRQGSLSPLSVTNLWTIEEFSRYANNAEGDQILKSPDIIVDVYKYKVHLQLRTNNGPHADPSNQDWISILVLLETENNDHVSPVWCHVKISLIDSENKEFTVQKIRAWFFPHIGFGTDHFINKGIFKNASDASSLLKDDKLVILCNITFLDKTANLQFDNYSEQMKMLLYNSDFTDVILRVDDEEIDAHKAILAANSPVFYAMFQHDTKESEEHVIEIVDCEFDVLKELIRYMYTGMVKNFENIAIDLSIMAEKYKISELKTMCENYLSHNKSIENCVGLYLHAKLHNFTDLEDEVKVFIRDNIKDIIDTAEFVSMKQTHPEIMLDLMNDSVEENND